MEAAHSGTTFRDTVGNEAHHKPSGLRPRACVLVRLVVDVRFYSDSCQTSSKGA
jgi:hypothetical protein